MCGNGGGEELGKIMPLLGVPFCCKQVINIKGEVIYIHIIINNKIKYNFNL